MRLVNLKDTMRECFVQVSAGYSAGLQWREIDKAFENRILTGIVINMRINKRGEFFFFFIR